VLPLTFENAADYEKVQENDRVSLVGLAELTPGRPVTVRLSHADGTTDEFRARHTLNAEQVHWFRAGSALNYARLQRQAAA
jgi:aconitate hydratase